MIPNELYSQIVHIMPIPCVDVLVEDHHGRILLVKRADEPAKDHWWFPGGRVHYRELRVDAAARKVREECGLTIGAIREVGTYDVILDMPEVDYPRHGITTLFHVETSDSQSPKLDRHNLTAEWILPREWLNRELHDFVRQGLNLSLEMRHKRT